MDIEQMGRGTVCQGPQASGAGTTGNFEDAARRRCLAPEDSFEVGIPCFEPVNRQMLLRVVGGKASRIL